MFSEVLFFLFFVDNRICLSIGEKLAEQIRVTCTSVKPDAMKQIEQNVLKRLISNCFMWQIGNWLNYW